MMVFYRPDEKTKNKIRETLEAGRSGQIAYFSGGGGGAEGTVDCRQWLTAIQKGTEPLVKPEQALVVTRILDNIYRAADTGKEVRF